MFFQPRWYKRLPEHLRMPTEKLRDLETLRKEFQLSNEAFVASIALTPWAVIRTQEDCLEKCRQLAPDATEKELWASVIFSRLNAILVNRGPDDPGHAIVVEKLELVGQIIDDINSWDDVLKFVFSLDEELGALDWDPTGTLDEINRVLEGKLSITLLKKIK